MGLDSGATEGRRTSAAAALRLLLWRAGAAAAHECIDAARAAAAHGCINAPQLMGALKLWVRWVH